jgi:hypothetical protein
MILCLWRLQTILTLNLLSFYLRSLKVRFETGCSVVLLQWRIIFKYIGDALDHVTHNGFKSSPHYLIDTTNKMLTRNEKRWNDCFAYNVQHARHSESKLMQEQCLNVFAVLFVKKKLQFCCSEYSNQAGYYLCIANIIARSQSLSFLAVQLRRWMKCRTLQWV